MSKLVCNQVAKSYGKNSVIENLDLTLESGKIYGLIGRNGAGKTTLLSMMSNQSPVTGGTVTLDGENIWENREALARICFSRELNVTNESPLINYTVKQYLKTARCFLPHWDEEMARKLVSDFHLDPKKKLSKLSKGMLSMVTIIVALASKAEFTFLDEPVAGLDVIARDRFYKLILEEFQQTGRTFLISTHIIEEASSVIEEVIILNEGRILLKENTQQLLDQAASVTGLQQEVDAAAEGMTVYHSENMGRSKAVTVLDREQLHPGFDVTIQPVSLEKLFIALCQEV